MLRIIRTYDIEGFSPWPSQNTREHDFCFLAQASRNRPLARSHCPPQGLK